MLYEFLLGEIAVQRGDLSLAAKTYLRPCPAHARVRASRAALSRSRTSEGD